MRRGVGLAILAMAGGCLPSRDNPHDPQGAPKAFVRIVDGTLERTPVARRCLESADVVAGSVPVAAIFRGRCAFLDASATVDPQGADLEDLDFRYAVIATAGVELAGARAIEPDPERPWIALLPTSLTLTLPTRVPITLEARVEDSNGNVGRAETSLVLLNAPPVAISDALRVIPDGGYAWRPAGEPVTARFDARRSYDPDGDPLTYTLERTDGTTLTSSAGNDPAFAIALVPTDSSAALVRVRVSDGDLSSPSTLSGVIVRPEGLWQQSAYRARALDGRKTLVGAVAGSFELVNFSGVERILFSAAIVYPPVVVPYTYPDMEPLPALTLPDSAGGFETAEDGLWVLGGTFAWLFDATGGDLSTTPLVTATNAVGAKLFAAADGGALWLAAPFGEEMSEIRRDGSRETIAALAGHRLYSMSTRPAGLDGSTEVWTLQTTEEGGAIVRHRSPVETEVFDAPALHEAVGLSFVDRDQAWLALPDRGFVLLDVEYLLAGASFEDAISLEVTYPVGLPNPLLVSASADRLGSYVFKYSSTPLLVTPHGVLDSVFGIDAVDQSGDLVYAIPNMVGTSTIYSGATVDPPIVVEHALPGDDHQNSNAMDRDRAFGGAWVTTDRPSIAWLSIDGRSKELVEFERRDASGSPLSPPTGPPPGMRMLRVSPDGTHAWGIEATPPIYTDLRGLWRFDLAADPPVATLVDDFALPFQLNTFAGVVPVGPDGADAWRFALIDPDTEESDYEVTRVSADGTSTVVFTVPPGEREHYASFGFPLLAPDLRGGLCIGVDHSTPSSREAILRHLPASGDPAVLLTAFSLSDPSLFGLVEVDASSDRGSDLCWLSWRSSASTWEVAAWNAETGVLERSWTTGADITSLSVVSHDEVWVGNLYDGTLLRVRFDGLTAVEETSYDGVPAGYFLPSDNNP